MLTLAFTWHYYHQLPHVSLLPKVDSNAPKSYLHSQRLLKNEMKPTCSAISEKCES